jgi:hypothetical protein
MVSNGSKFTGRRPSLQRRFYPQKLTFRATPPYGEFVPLAEVSTTYIGTGRYHREGPDSVASQRWRLPQLHWTPALIKQGSRRLGRHLDAAAPRHQLLNERRHCERERNYVAHVAG